MKWPVTLLFISWNGQPIWLSRNGQVHRSSISWNCRFHLYVRHHQQLGGRSLGKSLCQFFSTFRIYNSWYFRGTFHFPPRHWSLFTILTAKHNCDRYSDPGVQGFIGQNMPTNTLLSDVIALWPLIGWFNHIISVCLELKGRVWEPSLPICDILDKTLDNSWMCGQKCEVKENDIVRQEY